MPYVGKDKMCKYPGNDYLVALRRGHIFKVELSSGGEDFTSCMRLKACFGAILDLAKEGLPSVAAVHCLQMNETLGQSFGTW